MDDQLPTPNDLDASLEAALAADLAAPSDGGLVGPELADPLVDELALGGEAGSEEGLQYLVKLAEQYPGLKITLSFG